MHGNLTTFALNYFFSLCGNPNLSGQVSCNKKKKKHNLGVLVGVPVGISIGILLVVAAAAIWWHSFKTKGEKGKSAEIE